MWASIFENLMIMVLSIAALLAGGYLMLLLLGLGLKLKSRGREKAGLTDLWIESQKQAAQQNQTPDKTDPPN